MNYFEYMFRTLTPKATLFKFSIVRIIYLNNLVVSLLVSHSISQCLSQQVLQSFGRSVGQSVSQLISQSVSKSVCLSVSHLIWSLILLISTFLSPRCVEYVTSGNKNLLTLFCTVSNYLES